MTELGIFASILSIAGAGAQISMGFYRIASGIGSARKEVRIIAQDTNAFSQALTSLSQGLNGGTASSQQARAIAADLMVLCKDMVNESTLPLEVLKPLVKLTGTKRARFALRVRWLLQESKFAYHRQSLDSLRAISSLLVSTMNYIDASARMSQKPSVLR